MEIYKIDGLSELVDALKNLPNDLQNKILKSFLVKTGKKFIADELKTSLSYSERTKQMIRVVNDPLDRNAIYVGATRKIFWYRFADLGTKERKGRGKITPKNQFRSVIESQIEPIIDYTSDELGNEIVKNLGRRIKKINKFNNAI